MMKVQDKRKIKPSDLILRNELHYEHLKGVTGTGAHRNKKKYTRKKKHRKVNR